MLLVEYHPLTFPSRSLPCYPAILLNPTQRKELSKSIFNLGNIIIGSLVIMWRYQLCGLPP